MRSVCARCQTSLPCFPWDSRARAAARHGFCLPCLTTLADQEGSEVLALVEEVPYIAFVVDADLCIRAANHLACGFFAAAWVALLGHRVGEFLTCDHPFDLDHWRSDRSSPGCKVHALLVRTFQTREGGTVILPSLNPMDPEPPADAALQITALSMGDWVMVRLQPQPPPPRAIFRVLWASRRRCSA